jgi:hypothetical protein
MLYAGIFLGFSVAILGGAAPGVYRSFKRREFLDPVWTWRTVVRFAYLTAIVALAMFLGVISAAELKNEKERNETHQDSGADQAVPGGDLP